MSIFNWLKQQLLKKTSHRYTLPELLWQQALNKAVLLQTLTDDEQLRLSHLCAHFISKKKFTGVDGLHVSDEMKVLIAAQACLLILELDFSYFDGWVEVVVYPAAFYVEHDVSDAAGVVSRQVQLLSGEAWSRGQVILSWQDVLHDTLELHAGHQLVLHEFAHKLDARSGDTNGMPPLHKDMSREQWAQVLSHAYNHLLKQLEHHHHGYINAYAATNPAEYFAVLTEYFFTAPVILKHHCEHVYHQLVKFYRQNPQHRALPHLENTQSSLKKHP